MTIREAILLKAKECMRTAKNEADYRKAVGQLQLILGWQDADTLIADCERKIKELKEKEEAERLERERKAEEERIAREQKAEEKRIAAEKRKETILKIAKITAAAVCIAGVFVFLLIAVIIPAQKKNDFIAMYGQEVYEKVGLVEEGAYIAFGAYEQDNDTTNGKENIEWLVLEVTDGKALVISKYALDCKPYNTSNADVTWETCSLRQWLNNDFINAAFSVDERTMIPTVTVSADKNPEYNTNPGNATQDQVFLLSITEANKYFSSDSVRQCKPTERAVTNGAYVNRDNGNCWWWLRSPGYGQRYAAGVDSVGGVNEYGHSVIYGIGAVRPALWIDLNG